MNNYLIIKLGLHAGDKAIQLQNVSQLNETTPNTGGNTIDPQNAFISLVNIEEDRISKSPDNFVRTGSGAISYKNPRIYLNLYLLFSVNLAHYDLSLERLSLIIQFFQFQNVFTPVSNPDIPDGVDELIFDLYNLSFQDMNNLWGVMGSRYLPSVMYKMRLVIIEEDTPGINGSYIKSITVKDQ